MTFVDTRTTPSHGRTGGRPPRRGVIVVALLIGALLLITLGMALGRASVPHRLPDSPDAAPPATPVGPGPKANVDGVGIGWQRSTDGAIAAATVYLVGINGRGYVAVAPTRRRIILAIADPDQRAELATKADEVVRPEAPGEPFAAAFAEPKASAWRLVPLGYRVESYADDSAVISVWAVQITAGVGSANAPATARWSTTTLPLRWVEDDWKLDVAAARSVPGPSPATALGSQSGDLEVIATDSSFEEYAHASR